MVVDNTNPTVAERAELIALARLFGARTVGYFFDCEIKDCLARNRKRSGRDRVPDVALYVTRSKLELPAPHEGFDELWVVKPQGDSTFAVTGWSSPDESFSSQCRAAILAASAAADTTADTGGPPPVL